MNELALQAEILWPAIVAGLLVLSTHVPLGREVLQRGIIFLDLAIAQTAAFGVVLANTLWISGDDDHQPISTTIIAVVAAIAGSTVLYAIRKLEVRLQEAFVGILFVLMATGIILLLSTDPHGGERLKEILVGQILWLQVSDLLQLFVVYTVTLILWIICREKMGEWLFYPLFAITITLSTQVIGVYLVFASLIIPSVSTLHQKNPLLKAYAIGITGYIVGLIVSASIDLPAGAAIVWCLAMIGCLYFVFTGGLKMRETNKRKEYLPDE
ncbi:MAG: zinc/manganese transport system permease protein [Cellvibrionaceae bacterium]|jgi:zinc/manganese transport system permease protein